MPSLAIIPAAGQAVRFGSQKLLADVSGERLLDRTIASLLDAGVDQLVVVTAPDVDLSAARRLGDARVKTIANPDPSRGMFSSIQTGLFLLHGDPTLVLPGDMPFVTSATVVAVADECRRLDAVVVPRHNGRRGHPIAFPDRLRHELLDAAPTSSLSALLTKLGVARIEFDVTDPGVLRDVDRPEDLQQP